MADAKIMDIETQVNDDLKDVRKIIKTATVLKDSNLYSTVLKDFADSTKNSPKQIAFVEAYETALSVFRQTALELQKEMRVLTLEQRIGARDSALTALNGSRAKTTIPSPEKDELAKQLSDAIFFSNRYALYFAGKIGLELLNAEAAPVKTQFAFGSEFDNSRDRDLLATALSKVTCGDIRRVLDDKKSHGAEITDDTLKEILQDVFTAWTNQFSWDAKPFSDVYKQYGLNLKFKFKNYTLTEGTFKKKNDVVEVDDRFMPIRREDVIGAEGIYLNEDPKLGTILWSQFKMLSAYNPEMKKNPHKPANVVFIYGAPGCGKSFTSHAYVQSYADLCRKKGIPLKAMTLSTTDFASHYQNQSANKLNEIAEAINKFAGNVIMYVADADNLFQSRKDPSITQEQKQVLSVFFKMFDGTLIPRNGKFLAIMDANYIEGIDDATKSRLFDVICEVKRFETAEDFAKLAKMTVTKGYENLFTIPDSDWQEIGEYILKTPLETRIVGNLLNRVKANYEVPEDLIGKPFEEHVAFIRNYINAITPASILDVFEKYMATRLNISDASLNDKLGDESDRFRIYSEDEARQKEVAAMKARFLANLGKKKDPSVAGA